MGGRWRDQIEHYFGRLPTPAAASVDGRNQMTTSISRRRFLKRTAIPGVGGLLLPGGATARTMTDRANVALVGLGGRGRWFVQTMPKLANVVAQCDVDEYKAKDAFAEHPKVRKFKDIELPPSTLPRSRGHEREWLDAELRREYRKGWTL
jgi:hypothetical protein